MRIVRNLILLCILLTYQQYIVAQSYNLGKQKQSFAYKTLYANQVVKNNNETINHQPIQPLASVKDTHKEIVFNYCYGGIVFKKYDNIYKSLNQTQKDTLNLQKIQFVVLAYFRSDGKVYPNLKNQLKNAPSMKEEIAIFLSYYKE